MKRILLASVALYAAPALADSWTVGQQSVVFSPSGTNIIGDGSTTQGGIPPAFENGTGGQEPADVIDNFTQSTYLQAAQQRCTYPTGNAAGAVACTRAANQAKFRTACAFGFIGHFDPIVSPGTANFGHLHQFFGNDSVTKDSTYNSLRTTGESTCAGNKINRTAYWIASLMEDMTSGVSAARAFDVATVYYNTDAPIDAPKQQRFPRNYVFIGGYDPKDPNNTKLVTPMNTANAAAPSSYSIPGFLGVGTSSGTGFLGWYCLDSSFATVDGHTVNAPINGTTQPYLRNAAGQATLSCPSGGGLMAEIDMPRCWDGKNLHSGGSTGGGVGGVNLPNSDGRLHVSYQLHNIGSGGSDCPTGWYVLPQIEIKFQWSIKGAEDVSKFYLSSDRMNYGAPDPSSRSPCRQVSSYYCNGETFHTDWYGAWSYGTAAAPNVMIKWMNHCDGVKIIDSTGTINGDPAECDVGTIDSTNSLTYGTTGAGQVFGCCVTLRNAAATSKWRLELDTLPHDITIQHTH